MTLAVRLLTEERVRLRAGWAEQFCGTSDLSRAQQLKLTDAFSRVPRELFIDAAIRFRAYDDCALPIGFGQTISKPSTVAQMLSELRLDPGMRVLEVGVGSGYVSAILCALGVELFGIERVPQLAARSKRTLATLAFSQHAVIRCADGLRGWKECAPFDRIIVSAALNEKPRALLDQLVKGGRAVAPMSVLPAENPRLRRRYAEHIEQRLICWERGSRGFYETDLGSCRFVLAA